MDSIEALRWTAHGLQVLDQRRLPGSESWLLCSDSAAVAGAIRDMVVRGAPAIGVAAAYGAVLACREAGGDAARLEGRLRVLGGARPTAVNLAWAVDRMRQPCLDGPQAAEAAALAIHAEDLAANRRMAETGAALLPAGARVLTHCNTGSLATSGHGTALGVIRTAFRQGRLAAVYAGETRPWLQGARLTAWELQREGIPFRMLVDSAAAALMAGPGIDWVIVGADRIAANGDVANKVGTCTLAVLARHFGVRFMVVAPTSTVDPTLASGAAMTIEHRHESEILSLGGQRLAPEGVRAWNPVFDITPAELIDVIVTEEGVATPPFIDTLPGRPDRRLRTPV